LGAELRRALEELARARDTARDRHHLGRADDLQPLRGELGEPLDLEQLVRARDDLVPPCHRVESTATATLRPRRQGKGTATLVALGVWRSLVARSVRVGEVPSSNLGTPIDVGEPHGYRGAQI